MYIWIGYSIGSGYPLISCSPAVLISVFPDKLNILKKIIDTVHFTLPSLLFNAFHSRLSKKTVFANASFNLFNPLQPFQQLTGFFIINSSLYLAFNKRTLHQQKPNPCFFSLGAMLAKISVSAFQFQCNYKFPF